MPGAPTRHCWLFDVIVGVRAAPVVPAVLPSPPHAVLPINPGCERRRAEEKGAEPFTSRGSCSSLTRPLLQVVEGTANGCDEVDVGAALPADVVVGGCRRRDTPL